MIISENVPGHLVQGARAGFLDGVTKDNPMWQKVAMPYRLDGKDSELVNVGAMPMPTRSKGRGLTVQSFIEKSMRLAAVDWDITVGVSYNAVADDRIGDLERNARGAGSSFNLHTNKIVFDALNKGDTNAYGLCYDGATMFSNSHIDPGAAAYQIAQDNFHALSLSLDNFETVYTAASLFRNDQGEFTGIVPDLLVVPPALMRLAAQITGNSNAYDTANHETNPYAGLMSYMVVPWMDATAWSLTCSKYDVKPLVLVMREEPGLQSSWFDAAADDGGMYYFKFYGRYDVRYGDWRLASRSKP